MKLLVFVLSLLVLEFISVKATITEVPVSQNVSAGQTVVFTCATNSSEDIVTWSTVPDDVSVTPKTTNLPGGGKQSNLSVTALTEHNNTIVRCFVFDMTTESSIINEAILLVQGLLSAVTNLTSSEEDGCGTLHITWTAPYTLQGVPINYYTINITRNSDGVMLRSGTTNTTEYLYTVSSLGETLEVFVAAVNDVGTGNSSNLSTQSLLLENSSMLLIQLSDLVKSGNIKWIPTFYTTCLKCIEAISRVIVKACLNSYCVNVTGVINMSTDGVRVMATFNNLKENRKYTATVQVQYNGGVIQQSQPVEISTFDVQNVSVSIARMLAVSQLCLMVEYIEGNGTPPYTFVMLVCPAIEYVQNVVIYGTEGCINIETVNSNQTCNLFATDIDALNNIDTTPAVVITFILEPEVMSTSIAQVPSVTSAADHARGCSYTIPLSIGLSVLALTVTAIPVVIACVTCVILYQKRDAQKSVAVAAAPATSPSSVLYENIDPLSQSAEANIFSLYEDVSAVSSSQDISSPQSNIELKQCPAYGVTCTEVMHT